MNIFHKLTRRSLAKNRMRTLVTIIGIILSAAMFTAVAALITSSQGYMLESAKATTGDWHGAYYAATEDEVGSLLDTGRLEEGSLKKAQTLGYSAFEGITNESKPYLFVSGADALFFEEMAVYLTDGRLPENPNEILIPSHLMQNGGVKLKTGDSIELTLGDRFADSGAILPQTKSIQRDERGNVTERFLERESRSYTVVGHYDRPDWESYSAAGYTLLTLADEDTEGYRFDIFFRMEKPTGTYEFMSSNSVGVDWAANSDLLMVLGDSAYDGFFSFLYGFAAILIVLIMFGSISLIYNAFSISVSERTKQFGLLSSIGATGKQIRASVIYEALLLSLIGIPLGILSGLVGIGITLHFIGGMFSKIFYNKVDIPLTLQVSPAALLISAVIAFITIMISVRIPARRAMKVTAIDAIRQTGDVCIKSKKVKTSKLTQRLFGLEGTLASKNYKRSKKSYRATVISLFMSIVLFISASSFCYYLTGSVSGASDLSDYDIRYYHYNNSSEVPHAQLRDEIGAILNSVDGIERSSIFEPLYAACKIPEADMSQGARDFLKENASVGEEYSAYIYIVDDASYERYLSENGLDKDIYMNPENPVFIGNHMLSYMYETATIRNQYILENSDARTVPLAIVNKEKEAEYDATHDVEADGYDYSQIQDILDLEVALFAEQLIPGMSNTIGYGLNLMISQSCADAAFGNADRYRDGTFNYVFTVTDHAKAYDDMAKILSENSFDSSRLYDLAESEETMRSLVTIINVLSYGFIALISLISIANVFNTISTNIALRRREFAMLKSVGMTSGGFNRMMNYECIIYGLKALLYGLPVSIGITYLIFKTASGSFEQEFVLPVAPIVIAVLSVFIVVFITMMYSMRKIKKDNPIEALKLETL